MNLRPSLAVAAMVLTVGFATAEASPIAFDHNFDPADVFIKSNGGACTGDTATSTVNGLDHGGCVSLSYSYTLDGYDALTDTLTSGSLTFYFFDDNSPGPDQSGVHSESVNITLDGVLTGASPVSITNGSTGGSPFSASFSVLAELQADGQLTVFLSRPASGNGNNDFYFASSRLTAEGVRDDGPIAPPSSIPEPATLVLFGAGLAAAAVRRRRN